MEQKIRFPSDDLSLAGLLSDIPSERGVVITHPHPLYGGSMHNPVVKAIQTAYEKAGWKTLRFNFRGVGSSQGYFDQGTGEQRDFQNAVQWMQKQGIRILDSAGYSFGAWIISRIHTMEPGFHRVILVSPPVGFLPFESQHTIPSLRLVITGSNDEFGPLEKIRMEILARNTSARLEIIEGADHFYGGSLEKLTDIIFSEVNSVFG
jgi:alpha/beta superfamily hydrolase